MKSLLIIVLALGILLTADNACMAERKRITEKKRKEINAKHDKLKLRGRTEFVRDCSPEFLKAPPYPEFLKTPGHTNIAGEYTIARVAPTVQLRILPNLEPEYYSGTEQYMVGWANWAGVARSEDNRFYICASDHLSRGCHLNLYEYCLSSNSLTRVLDVSKLLDWTSDTYTDAKVHGNMGITRDGTLWAATYIAVAPWQTKEWWLAGYRGSWLFSYNINTGKAVNWGAPLIGGVITCFAVDTRRSRFVGEGQNNAMLGWDCTTKKVTYAGYPPKGWIWWDRAILCDEATGKFWGLDLSERPFRFMSFDPERNRFQRYDVFVPLDPRTLQIGLPRGHTSRPAMDGYYYWATTSGTLFKFKPEGKDGGPEIEPAGFIWGEGHWGQSAMQLALGPNGRYIYYQPTLYPSPLVQYDVKTGKTKAICFLQDYYFEKYGYWLGSSAYGLEISTDGSFIVMCENGTFMGRYRTYGHPSVLVISIPAEERPVD